MKNLPYSVLIQWSEEDQRYIASLPEFGRFCKADGATYEEAAKNAGEVLEMLVESAREEGEELPQPLAYAFPSEPTDPAFWRMIEDRRKGATIPLEQLKSELLSQPE